MEQKHTALPWYNSGSTVYGADPGISANRTPLNVVAYTMDDLIARSSGDESRANAQFIVTACNSFYLLLAVAKDRLEELKEKRNTAVLQDDYTGIVAIDGLIQDTEIAIAKATEEVK